MLRLAADHGWRRGVELGLGQGRLFARFIVAGLEMIGVDLGLRQDRRAAVEAIGGRVFWMSTHEAAALIDDGWADFVFIDAGHSYEAVRRDIEDWERKVRLNGWFGGHDYHSSHPGVVKAVDEAFPNRRLLDHWVWVRA